MSKSEISLVSGTYAKRLARREARVRELAAALDQDDLRQDRESDFPGSLVPQPEPDGRVQARVVPRIASDPRGDVAEDERDLPPAADQADVPGPAAQRRLQHRLVQRMAPGEDGDEIGRIRRQAAQRILRQI